jgi:hypothetical protein
MVMLLSVSVASKGKLDFPASTGTEYPGRCQQIREYLENNIYSEIEKSVIIQDIEAGRNAVYLNNHGSKHVDDVIKRASQIIEECKLKLSAYEEYLLLAAILLHDVGNIWGREEHEKKLGEVIEALGPCIGPDSAEKRVVVKIASAHGGHDNGKTLDTIGQLLPVDRVLGETVRKRLLASILRFADELADDRSRASRFVFGKELVGGSEVFHAYSQALHSVMIDDSEVTLAFDLNRKLATDKLKKGAGESYLLDEIFRRTIKMHRERMYCMRFIRQAPVERIRINIEVFESFGKDKFPYIKPICEPIRYCLEEKGYPQVSDNIAELCPELQLRDGEALKTILATTEK